MKIAYLSRKDGTDMRVAKTCNSLVRLGHEVVFVGWDRTPDKPKDIELAPAVKRCILRRAGKHAQNSFQGWGSFYRHLVRTLWRERPDAVHVVNEEMAILALPFKRILFRWLIVDVFDSVIANKFRLRVLDWAAVVCRGVANTMADRIVETGEELQDMLGRHARKSVIVENAPRDPGPEYARKLPTGQAVRLAIGGNITRRRLALDQLLGAVDALPPGSVQIEASGWLYDDYAKEVFAKHPAVRYQWLKTPREFLELAATCDALLYIRGDSDDSPYRAAVLPNRIFDSLVIGRPLIVNAQLSLSKWVQQDHLGYVVPDLSPEALVAVIKRLRDERPRLGAMAARLRGVFLQGHTWDVMERRLDELYTGLEGRRPSETLAVNKQA